MINYDRTTNANGLDSVTVFDPRRENPILMATSAHPAFREIVAGLESGDESVLDLFDVGQGVAKKFRQVTERVSYDGKDILWDGVPVHNTLSDQLLRALEHGESNLEPLARFWEKLESNPDAHSRAQAFDFLASHAFQITEDGDVVGYKGMFEDGDGYRSWHASSVVGKPSAYINGNPLPERVAVSQKIGDVVTMPRDEVHNDPSLHCSRGLHVATRDYASDYGDVVLRVTFNPRDIVSVPNDANGRKVRVWRYVVDSVAVEGHGTEGPVVSKASNEYTWAGDVGTRV